MTPNIYKRAVSALRVLNGTIDLDQSVQVNGEFVAKVIRDGRIIKEVVRKNIVLYTGLNRIAYRMANYGNTIGNYCAVGTQTAAHSLGSVQAGIGECGPRKAWITLTQSHEFFTGVVTYGGFADFAVSSVAFDTVAMTDWSTSSAGSGFLINAANGLGISLQSSDFLNLTLSIRVGSHNVGQTT